jgi:hypothetical protein
MAWAAARPDSWALLMPCEESGSIPRHRCITDGEPVLGDHLVHPVAVDRNRAEVALPRGGPHAPARARSFSESRRPEVVEVSGRFHQQIEVSHISDCEALTRMTLSIQRSAGRFHVS